MGCEVIPQSIPLFVDESLDAPPAIFTVICRQTGPLRLIFTVWQDGAQVAALTQPIEALERLPEAHAGLSRSSLVVPVDDHPSVIKLRRPAITTGAFSASEVSEDQPTQEELYEFRHEWNVMLNPPTSLLYIHPGERAEYALTVTNQGYLAETIRLFFQNEAAMWAFSDKDQFQLMPGETIQAVVSIMPPPETRPGLFPLRITAVSMDEPDEWISTSELSIQVVEAAPGPSGCLSSILQKLFHRSLILLLLTFVFLAGSRKRT